MDTDTAIVLSNVSTKIKSRAVAAEAVIFKPAPTAAAAQSAGKSVEKSDEAPSTKRVKSECELDNGAGGSKDSAEQVTSTQPSLREFQSIPIFIVDYHNDVLEFIYRCLASRHLPLEKNILVHFDSHPDLVIARDIPASASFDKDIMLTELAIENWIMPTLYAGHFDRMIWIKNSWCQQIPNGIHKFHVGQHDGRIGVDCVLDYFITDGNFCDTDKLQDTRDVELQVYDADTPDLDPTKFITKQDAHNFVLDIDLDFFSTSNPFLEIYKEANCYEQLKEIFHFPSVVELKNTWTAIRNHYGSIANRRKLQMEMLRKIFYYLEDKRSLEDYRQPQDPTISADIKFDKIVALVESLKSKFPDEEIDWLLIYDSGCTTDNRGLPHHISTDVELKQYFANFKQFLQRLPVPPVIVTMAHSAQDDYCPQNQVSFIEEQVLRILSDVFGERIHKTPILHYMDDEWDIMKL